MRRHAKAWSAGSTSGAGSSRGLFGRAFATRGASSDTDGSGAPSHRGLTALLLTALALSALAIGPAAAGAVVNKGVNGYFGATGAGNGQLSSNAPRGTAVNQTSGNVYTADSGNNRIVVFSSSGTFLRAFGQDVVESGPGNSGTGYEICVAANGDVCKAGITSASTGGAMNGPQGVAVDAAGNVYVSEQTKLRVQKFDANGAFLLTFGQDVVESGPGNSPAANAVQSLTVTATAGKYTLTFGGKTTPELAFNATAAQVQTALLALTSIGAGNVEVTGASFPYTITFKGALANNPEPTIVATSGVGPGNELEGGIVSVVNTTAGSSGYEVCVAANGDVCKTGVTGSTRGAFKSTFNGHLAAAPTGSPNAGNVLVADPANLRVQEFSSTGAFVRTFGLNVVAAGAGNNGTTNFEVCAAANGDACQIGVTGAGAGTFSSSVNRVAEDVEGNIYTVESATNFRVQKFTLPGNVVTPAVGNFLTGATSKQPTDVAIDPANKDVLITKLFAAGEGAPTCPATGAPSVANERRILEYSAAGVLEATHMTCAGITVANGLAVRSSASTGDVYVSSTTEASRLYVLNTPLNTPTVGFSGVSDISAHSATVSGFVNPNGPAALPYGLTTSYRFAYKRSVDSMFVDAPAGGKDIGRGTGNLLVSQQLPGLEAGTSYDVKLVARRLLGAGSAETATFSFTTPVAPAEVGIPSATTAATEGGDVRAALWGRVNPNSQATTYRFDYGTTAAYGTKVPTSEASVGSGPADVPVAQYLTGLQPETTYHFRLVAKSASGVDASPDQTFTTPALGSDLPNNRGAELVSPADKGTQGSVADFRLAPQLFARASDDGSSFIYPLQNGIDTSTAGGWLRQLASRTPAGWLSTQLSAPSLIPPPQIDGLTLTALPSQVLFSSPDLSCGVLETYNPLTNDTPQVSVELGISNLYVWRKDGGYELVTNRVPLNPGIIASISKQVDAADDCSRVYFRSEYQLIAGGSGLYEWDEGVLRDAGILPDGTPGAGAVVGGEVDDRGTARWDAVSTDGSRLFFSAISNEGPDKGKRAVFMREDGGASVVGISQSLTSVPASGARFEAASPDGSHVFFRANYGLTATRSLGPINGDCGVTEFDANPTIEKTACDLYDYNVETGELTDLSADRNPADAAVGAQIQGTVAISDDGSYVYFAALGQLIPGKGRTYVENAGNTSANIYLAHDGEFSYVVNLGQYGPDPGGFGQAGDLLGPDATTSGAALMRRPGSWNASTTADGRKLLFVSSRNLTGYESGGVERMEAYLYSADTGQITCVSCRLDGLPSLSMPSEFTPEFEIELNQSSWLLAGTSSGNPTISVYRPRSMSKDGSRIFFSSPNVLAPGAVAGKRNVYQWENAQVRFLAIAERSSGRGIGLYLDSSASGDDVFIGTREQLAPQDIDFVSDVYDLRVGGGFTPEVTPIPCHPAADECQGAPTAQPNTPTPASAGFVGAGNPPPAKPGPKTCPKGKVRKHGKCVKRRKKGGESNSRAAKTNRGGTK